MLFDGVTVRESLSLEALKSSTFSKNIYFYPDPAFGMAVEKPELDFPEGDIVAINASNLMMSPKYGNTAEMIYANYRCLIEYCLNILNLKVLLLPHVMKSADLSVLRNIRESFKDNEKVYLLEDETLTAPQLKYIISKCRFLITSRTHASIAAYSTGVPVLVIGYSVKSRGIAEDIFGDSEHYVLPLDQMNEETTLRDRFKWIAAHEDEIRRELGASMPSYIVKSKGFVSLFQKKELVGKEACCGCYACYNACPQKCISFEMDMGGFQYPLVDEEKCIHCDKCRKVCPWMREGDRNDPANHQYYAAYNKDEEILKKSSSGGMFFALAQHIIEDRNGVVYGACAGDRFDIHHERAESLRECNGFLGSKYLQSKIGDTFAQCRLDLENGRTVLFSGTPCQIAGLYAYLGRDYDDLYTVGVICHGVPSKTIFDKFILEKEAGRSSRVVSYRWRDKTNGWGPNHISIVYENGGKEITTSQENPFQKGFLDNLYLRPTCYHCKYARIPRMEDISLADFWGYTGPLTKGNENGGLSLVVVTNAKGAGLFEEISDGIVYEKVTEGLAKSKSRHLSKMPRYNEMYPIVMRGYVYKSFNEIKKLYINRSVLYRRIMTAKAIVVRNLSRFNKGAGKT